MLEMEVNFLYFQSTLSHVNYLSNKFIWMQVCRTWNEVWRSKSIQSEMFHQVQSTFASKLHAKKHSKTDF